LANQRANGKGEARPSPKNQALRQGAFFLGPADMIQISERSKARLFMRRRTILIQGAAQPRACWSGR
jgi:hypothetical protein